MIQYLIMSALFVVLTAIFGYHNYVNNTHHVVEHDEPRTEKSMDRLINHSIIGHAKEEINIFHGDLHGIFFCSTKITDRIKKISKSGGRVTILFGPKLCVCREIDDVKRFLDLVMEKHVKLFMLENIEVAKKIDERFHHFATADSRHIWLEETHGPIACNKSIELFNVNKSRNIEIRGLVDRYDDIFLSLLSEAKEIRPNYFCEDVQKTNLVVGYDAKKDAFIEVSDDKFSKLLAITKEYRNRVMENAS